APSGGWPRFFSWRRQVITRPPDFLPVVCNIIAHFARRLRLWKSPLCDLKTPAIWPVFLEDGRPGLILMFRQANSLGLGMNGMKQVLIAALVAAGLAAFGAQAGAGELRTPLSLTSFGAAQQISSYQMSAAGLTLGPAQTFS